MGATGRQGAHRGPAFRTKVQLRRLLVTPLLTALLLSLGASTARANPFLPPAGKVFTGVAGQPVSSYVAAVGKHPAVYQEFIAWGQYLPGITQDAANARARLLIHITTASGSAEAITPGAIAGGRGDAWLIALNGALYGSGLVTYVRLMAEMDGYWNPYCAYNANGSRRDSAHSTNAYKQAWKRVALILRGGSREHIDAVLRGLGMPPLRTTGDLPQPKVAMLWVPQVSGAPDVAGNQPSDYWPGKDWVDWVGTDFYSNAPNFSGLSALYGAYRDEPFVFGEYALWGSDDVGFIDNLFSWVNTHSRTRMVVYNQGVNANGPFRLWRYPNAARALRQALAGPKYLAYAPEFAH